MSCNNLKAPQPPTLESLPSNVKMPQGLSLDSVKGMASGKGLSDAMNNAQGMISSNLNGLKDKFSPDAIASKIGDTITGIADGIASQVSGAINSITSIGARIKSFDPSSAAGGIKDKLQGQLSGAADFSGLATSLQSGKCAGSYVKQAGEFNKAVSDNAKNKVAGLPKKTQRRMVSDSQFRQSKTDEITEEVKTDTYNSAVDQANAKAQNQSAQDELTSYKVDSKSRTNSKGCGDWMIEWANGSFIHANNVMAGSVAGYLYIDNFQRIGSLFGGYTDDVFTVLSLIDDARKDYAYGLGARHYFRTLFNGNPCGTRWDTVGEIDGELIPGTGQVFKDEKDRNILGLLMVMNPNLWVDQQPVRTKGTYEGPNVMWRTWTDVYNTFFNKSEWSEVYIRNIRDITSSKSNHNISHRPGNHMWVDDYPSVFGDATKARDNFLKVIEKAEDKLYSAIYSQKKVLKANAESSGNDLVASKINEILDDNTKVVGQDLIMTKVVGNKLEFVWSVATVDWKSPEITRVDHLEGTPGKELW